MTSWLLVAVLGVSVIGALCVHLRDLWALTAQEVFGVDTDFDDI